MHIAIRAIIVTILCILTLTIILRGRKRSLALFSVRKEEAVREQLDNFFKYNVGLGVVTVVLALIALFTFLPPWFFTYESDAAPFVLITIGSVSALLCGVFAAYLLAVSLRVTKETGLKLTDGEILAVRKGILLAGSSIAIILITAIPVVVYLSLHL